MIDSVEQQFAKIDRYLHEHFNDEYQNGGYQESTADLVIRLLLDYKNKLISGTSDANIRLRDYLDDNFEKELEDPEPGTYYADIAIELLKQYKTYLDKLDETIIAKVNEITQCPEPENNEYKLDAAITLTPQQIRATALQLAMSTLREVNNSPEYIYAFRNNVSIIATYIETGEWLD